MSTFHTTLASEVGELKLIASDRGLAAILWENDNPARVKLDPGERRDDHPVLTEAGRQLAEYFSGQRQRFSIPLAPSGTEFQKTVWRALAGIPFGETRSYLQIAQQLGNPKATRAVGAANGRNPISIVIPCHRVIGSDGRLTGFAGGMAAKAYLLDLELETRRSAGRP